MRYEAEEKGLTTDETTCALEEEEEEELPVTLVSGILSPSIRRASEFGRSNADSVWCLEKLVLLGGCNLINRNCQSRVISCDP